VENKTLALYFIIAILLAGSVFQYCWNSPLFPDAVPDEETALKRAEDIFVVVYGEEAISDISFTVTYDESKKVWFVIGNLPPGTVGGVPEAAIRKRDGMILSIFHGY